MVMVVDVVFVPVTDVSCAGSSCVVVRVLRMKKTSQTRVIVVIVR